MSSSVRPVAYSMAWEAPCFFGCVTTLLYLFSPVIFFTASVSSRIFSAFFAGASVFADALKAVCLLAWGHLTPTWFACPCIVACLPCILCPISAFTNYKTTVFLGLLRQHVIVAWDDNEICNLVFTLNSKKSDSQIAPLKLDPPELTALQPVLCSEIDLLMKHSLPKPKSHEASSTKPQVSAILNSETHLSLKIVLMFMTNQTLLKIYCEGFNILQTCMKVDLAAASYQHFLICNVQSCYVSNSSQYCGFSAAITFESHDETP